MAGSALISPTRISSLELPILIPSFVKLKSAAHSPPFIQISARERIAAKRRTEKKKKK